MNTSPNETLPVEHNDPINARILAISEDQIAGFVREPFAEIAARAGLPVETVLERITRCCAPGRCGGCARLCSRPISLRRARRLESAAGENRCRLRLDVAARSVFRSRRAALDRRGHARLGIQTLDDAESAAGVFAATARRDFVRDSGRGTFPAHAGEGHLHLRRRARAAKECRARARKRSEPATMIVVQPAKLTEKEWTVLTALKREFAPEEIHEAPWVARAEEAGVSFEEFFAVAEDLTKRKIIGRFSTFLEHVKPSAGGVRVTRFNALFHWAVPAGARNGSGRRSRAARDSDPLLLARGRAGISQRQHHGGRARDRQSAPPRAQGGDRSASCGMRDAGFLHECFLGRAERDQAVGNFAADLPAMAGGSRARKFEFACDTRRSRLSSRAGAAQRGTSQLQSAAAR